MSEELRRPLLRRGARVAVVSPASAANTEKIDAGVSALEAYGYSPAVMTYARHRGPLYYAGFLEQRVNDLFAAFSSQDAVLCTRGGWGSAELLPLLQGRRDWLQARPKVFVGYSDHTALQTFFLQQCGWMTMYGPMVAADWSLPEGVDERSWTAAMSGEAYSLGSADGLEVLRPGRAEGRLLGGCLAILEAGLGTPWAFEVNEPCVLFLEDIHVKPYQWDRMLQHLRFAGVMKHVTGVVFGDMEANVTAAEMELLRAACLHGLRDFKGPVAMGLRCGHVTGGNRTLVLGEQASLVCENEAVLRIAGAATQDRTEGER